MQLALQKDPDSGSSTACHGVSFWPVLLLFYQRQILVTSNIQALFPFPFMQGLPMINLPSATPLASITMLLPLGQLSDIDIEEEGWVFFVEFAFQ